MPIEVKIYCDKCKRRIETGGVSVEVRSIIPQEQVKLPGGTFFACSEKCFEDLFQPESKIIKI